MRKPFTTTIDDAIQKDFKIACIKNDANMNDVLEELMKRYSSGELKIEASNDKK